jgi:hypothetical protein
VTKNILDADKRRVIALQTEVIEREPFFLAGGTGLGVRLRRRKRWASHDQTTVGADQYRRGDCRRKGERSHGVQVHRGSSRMLDAVAALRWQKGARNLQKHDPCTI